MKESVATKKRINKTQVRTRDRNVNSPSGVDGEAILTSKVDLAKAHRFE